jgi:hypothetical protein
MFRQLGMLVICGSRQSFGTFIRLLMLIGDGKRNASDNKLGKHFRFRFTFSKHCRIFPEIGDILAYPMNRRLVWSIITLFNSMNLKIMRYNNGKIGNFVTKNYFQVSKRLNFF